MASIIFSQSSWIKDDTGCETNFNSKLQAHNCFTGLQ